MHTHQEAFLRGSTMRQPFVAAQPAIVMTRVWLPEHEWLHSVFSCSENQSPTFRFPDLLSACVALVLGDSEATSRLRRFLITELSIRDPKSPRRTCHLWQRQFDDLLREHRAPWNSHPNPKFDLDAIATGCVAVVRSGVDPVSRTLRQARLNVAARAIADHDLS
ncbi:MAG: hypothetical protein K2Y02_10705 [Burkholderiaceae bacterium]|jgi:hypothetical protein|nr:hypothetical protein [Burkholderiaceae bacterium]